MRCYTWEIVVRKSIADQNVLPGTLYFKCKSKTDWKMRKFKARYCVRGDVQKKLSPEPLNYYYSVVQQATVRLMLIFQCILGFQSQSIDFKNAFSQADISNGDTLFIEITRDFKSDGGQHDVVIKLDKILYGQSEPACICYEKF